MTAATLKNRLLHLAGLLLTTVALGASGSYLVLTPQLPDISSLKKMQHETPLQVYSRDGKLISEFGAKHSLPLPYRELPKRFVQAFLAAEDDSFFQHKGIDYLGLARAMGEIATTGSIRSGGSTITMQVAKNYFLSNERTFSRKFTEIMLAKRIEDSLTKEEILELYLNKIYLGQRAYGVGAAARIYYDKRVQDLTIAEMAMIAGLPKAPSKYNPVVNPTRAMTRRNWIIGRMRKLGYITETEHAQALSAPVGLHYTPDMSDVKAPYLAEMVREALLERFGESVYNAGYRVYTTVSAANQNAATAAVENGLLAYDQRHGWRGPEGTESSLPLKSLSRVGGLEPARVIAVEPRQITVVLRDGREVVIAWEQLNWARKHVNTDLIGPPLKSAREVAVLDDIVRVQELPGKRWRLAQIPQVQGQLIAMNPESGAIEAVVGGFDFGRSKFNRALQGWRQAGSTIKPLIYAKALERGYTPETLITDGPLSYGDWTPSNADGEFLGPITLRRALYLSRNLVSIRLLEAIGVDSARTYLSRFGIDKARMPRNLTLALGSADVLPVQMATAYASIANGGLRVNPYFIEKVVDRTGKVVFQANPNRVCRRCEAPRPVPVAPEPPAVISETGQDGVPPEAQSETLVITPPEPAPVVDAPAYVPNHPVALRIMNPRAAVQTYSILQDVIARGTGRGALALGRSDLGGKTGTTNEARDAWFAGFNGRMVAVSWVGFDEPRTLGKVEYGGFAALPIWNQYMAVALRGVPSSLPPMPVGQDEPSAPAGGAASAPARGGERVDSPSIGAAAKPSSPGLPPAPNAPLGSVPVAPPGPISNTPEPPLPPPSVPVPVTEDAEPAKTQTLREIFGL